MIASVSVYYTLTSTGIKFAGYARLTGTSGPITTPAPPRLAESRPPCRWADSPRIVSDSLPLAEISEDSLTGKIAEMQAQIESLREQLTESQRLATIGTIAAVIAHE